MKKTIIILLFFTGLFSLYAQTDLESKREKFDPAKDPFVELKSTVTKAKQENKRIILDVGGEWCIWCHRLDIFILGDEEIKKCLDENFITLKINSSKENKNEKFLGQYPKVDGYPHMFVLDGEGKLLHSQNTGLLEKEKSYDKEKIIAFLKEWAPKEKNKNN